MSNPGTPQPTQGVPVSGPDGKKYNFPAGTTKDQAIAYFKRKGIGASANPAEDALRAQGVVPRPVAPDPTKDNAKHIGQMAAEGGKEFGQMLWNTGRDIIQNPNWVFGKDSVYSHMIDKPAAREGAIASAAWKLGQYDRASLHETIGAVPLIGPWIMEGLYEPMISGDPWGGLAKFETQLAAGELTGKVTSKAREAVRPENLRTTAGKLMARASGTPAPEKSMSPAEAAEGGRAMAEAKIIGTKASLPRKIEAVRQQKAAEVDAAVRRADAMGRTQDVSQSLDNAVDAVKARAVATGNKQVMIDLDNWKQRQSNDVSAQPNAQGKYTLTPKNLQAMKPSDIWRQTQRLEGDAGWLDKNPPEHIQRVAKIYREALGKHLEDAAPGVGKLRADESLLIRNRNAAQAQMQSNFEKAKNTFTSYFRSPGTLGLYALLRGLGMSWMGAIAPVVGLKTLYDSVPSTTFRAAALQWASELMDGTRQSAVNGGGQPPTNQLGLSAPSGTTGGPSGTPAPSGAPSGTGGRPAPPFAPATVVSTNPGPVGAPGASLDPHTLQAVSLAKRLLPPSAPVEQVMVAAQQIKATQALKRAVGPEMGGSATKGPEAPISQSGAGKPNVSSELQGGKTGAASSEDLPQLPRGYAIQKYPWMGHDEYLITGPDGKILTKDHLTPQSAMRAVQDQLDAAVKQQSELSTTGVKKAAHERAAKRVADLPKPEPKAPQLTLQQALARQQFMLGAREMGGIPTHQGEGFTGTFSDVPSVRPAPKVTKVAEGVSGGEQNPWWDPKSKGKAAAMINKLDDLVGRKPKSGAEKVAIDREIDQIKKGAQTGVSKAERGQIEKKIKDRERLGAKREEEKSKTVSVEDAGGIGQASRQAASGDIERWRSVIEMGVEKLKSMGTVGQDTARQFAVEAKRHDWSPHEQMSQLAEMIEFLKANPGLAVEKMYDAVSDDNPKQRLGVKKQ